MSGADASPTAVGSDQRGNGPGRPKSGVLSIVTAQQGPYDPPPESRDARHREHSTCSNVPNKHTQKCEVEWEETMAAKKKAGGAKASGGDLIISKSRTKAAAKKCNVGSEFYGALDKKVRAIIADAEARATGNKRKTLKAVDL